MTHKPTPDTIAEIARKLTKAQREVLGVLGSYEDFGYLNFQHAADRTGLSRDDVRAAVHSMKPLDLVVFGTGLATDDGDFYGSGYAASDLGLEVAEYFDDAALKPHLEQSSQ